jgi:hypothetical protein
MWPFNEADIYFNGVQLSAAENIFLDQPQSTETELRGMFLRNAFDITELVNKRDGASNSLAILVNPPNPGGHPAITAETPETLTSEKCFACRIKDIETKCGCMRS